MGCGAVGCGAVGCGAVGSGAVGSGAVGCGAVGCGAVGCGAVGRGAVGCGAEGCGAVGTFAVGLMPVGLGTGAAAVGIDAVGVLPQRSGSHAGPQTSGNSPSLPAIFRQASSSDSPISDTSHEMRMPHVELPPSLSATVSQAFCAQSGHPHRSVVMGSLPGIAVGPSLRLTEGLGATVGTGTVGAGVLRSLQVFGSPVSCTANGRIRYRTWQVKRSIGDPDPETFPAYISCIGRASWPPKYKLGFAWSDRRSWTTKCERRTCIRLRCRSPTLSHCIRRIHCFQRDDKVNQRIVRRAMMRR